uniref:Uncharacterized protein n=1 Tax=Laticauda laticaudata TaxID=8630 RepID=A0A8C5RQ99_LATLA
MPDQISVSEFVSETNEDYKSPTASNFTTRMVQCRNTVTAIEEVSGSRRRGQSEPSPCSALACKRRLARGSFGLVCVGRSVCGQKLAGRWRSGASSLLPSLPDLRLSGTKGASCPAQRP